MGRKIKGFRRILIGAALCCAASLAMAQVVPDAQKLANDWTSAYNNHNTAGLSALYSESANLMMHGHPTITGRDAIGEYWAQDFKQENPITTLQVTHTLEGVDMILVHGNYQVINRNSGVMQGQGRFAHLWMREAGGEWKLDRDLWDQPSAHP